MDNVGEQIDLHLRHLRDLQLAIGDTQQPAVIASLTTISLRLLDELDDLITEYAKETSHG